MRFLGQEHAVHEIGGRPVLQTPCSLCRQTIRYVWLIIYSNGRLHGKLRRVERDGDPGCRQRSGELVVVVGRALVRMAVERGCDRHAVVVLVGMV